MTAKKEKMHISVLITVIVAAIVVVGAFGWAIWRNSDAAIEGTVAVTVGENNVSKAEFSYYYSMQVNYFLNTYEQSGLLSYLGIDTDKSLSSQTCLFDSDKSWAEYFAESALDEIEETYVLYSESVKAGFTPDSEEIQKTLEQYKSTFETYAKTSSMDLDSYLTAAYGKGVTWDRFKTYMERSLIASQYGDEVYDGIEVSEDEIDEYFKDNKASFYTVDYRSVTFDYDEDDAASKTEAKKKADEFAAKATDADSFKSLAWDLLTDAKKTEYEKTENTDYTLKTGSTVSSLASSAHDWFVSSDRKPNDVTVVDDADSECYVVYSYVLGAVKDYKLANVRMFFISEDDTDDIKTATSAWNSSAKTEDAFKELVAKYNASSENGGLYENITKGYTVDVVNDWIFADGRKAGDAEIIADTETEDSEGSYFVYYVSSGDEYWHYASETQVRSKKYSSSYEEFAKLYETVKKDNVIKDVIS